jgi:hypothetical protein
MNPQIIITISGGLVQHIAGIPKGHDIIVLDLDTQGADEDQLAPCPWPEIIQEYSMDDPDGTKAFITRWCGPTEPIEPKELTGPIHVHNSNWQLTN